MVGSGSVYLFTTGLHFGVFGYRQRKVREGVLQCVGFSFDKGVDSEKVMEASGWMGW